MKNRLLGIFIFQFIFYFSSFSQICSACMDYSPEVHIDDDQRYWEDPDGVLYLAENIFQPTKVGTWTYSKQIENGDHVIISTRYVHCVETPDNCFVTLITIALQ